MSRLTHSLDDSILRSQLVDLKYTADDSSKQRIDKILNLPGIKLLALFVVHPLKKAKIIQVAEELGVNRRTAGRYLEELAEKDNLLGYELHGTVKLFFVLHESTKIVLVWATEAIFAYATGWDESKGRYLGLKAAEHITVTLSSQNLIVKPEIAQRQFEADATAKPVTPPVFKEKTGSYKTDKEKTIDTVVTADGSSDSQVTVIVPPKRFYGSVKLDALRLRRDIGQIADEVIQHLSSLVDAEV